MCTARIVDYDMNELPAGDIGEIALRGDALATEYWRDHDATAEAFRNGWLRTGDPKFHDWYERTWQICLDHFVDWENGEWRQKLDRSFQPITAVVALPVKDPFHLPRSLILQLELLR